VAAAQFPGVGIEHFEIPEMIHVHEESRSLAPSEMSYADLAASMGKPRGL
jgi:hypothetical protein